MSTDPTHQKHRVATSGSLDKHPTFLKDTTYESH